MDKKKIIRIAIYVVVAIVAIYVAYRIYVKVKDRLASNKLGRELDNSIDTGNLSYDISQYQSLANKLYTAMDGPGTDEDAVGTVFNQMQTRSDVLMLMKQFGVRDGDDLSTWLTSELDNDEMEKYVNGFLKSKNINYTF